MNFISYLNRFIGIIIGSLKQLSNGPVWLLLFVYFLLSWLLLYAHHYFTLPIFEGPLTFWVSLFGEEHLQGFTHYPDHLLFLGYIFGWSKFYFAIVLEGLFLGLVIRRFRPDYIKSGMSGVMFWLNLALGWTIFNGLVLLVNYQLPLLLADFLHGSGKRQLLFNYAVMPFLITIIFAIFYFVIPVIALKGKNIMGGIKESFRIFLKNPFTCFFMAMLVMMFPIIISFVTGNPDKIVGKFNPELVYWILVFSLFVDMLANFFWMSSASIFLDEE